MKLDPMTIGAVGFAAFAAWYVLKKPGTATGATNPAVAQAAAQHAAVIAAGQQNVDSIYSLFGASDNYTNLPGMGGAQGLTA